MKQHTIGEEFTLEGKGLHTGMQITLHAMPADEGKGIVIRRVDLGLEMKASAEYVGATERGTVLMKGECKCSTIEHFMAALAAYSIDNCIIEVNAPEFPILDGSAAPYVEALERVGVIEQSAERQEFIVKKPMRFEIGGSEITLEPAEDFSVEVLIDFNSPVLKTQRAMLNDISLFSNEISSCRTFVFVREIEQLVMAGLIKGGDLKNALVIYDSETSLDNLNKIAGFYGQKIDSAAALGYLNGPLKFDNEPARHKLLDLIGDLYLIGMPIRGKVKAIKPGHGVNTAVAKKLLQTIKKPQETHRSVSLYEMT